MDRPLAPPRAPLFNIGAVFFLLVRAPGGPPILKQGVAGGCLAKLRLSFAECGSKKDAPRAEFLDRLRRAVAWLNQEKHDELLNLCVNLKVRARAVLSAKPSGSKTKW